MSEPDFSQTRTAVIQDVIRLTREKYVYPDKGEAIAKQIQAKLDAGDYDHLNQGSELAFQLTSDLRALSEDYHWHLNYDPRGSADGVDPETEQDSERMARYLAAAREANYGFKRVEVLKGNIGSIDIRHLYPSEYGGDSASAAMNLVANCDALIFDLRKCHGGFPSMIQLVTSYLFDPEPRHINSFYYRPSGETQQFWTLPYVPGVRRADIPAYVLVSGETGSAPEEFAYNLLQMERATLVGETTLGAAHPVTKEVVQGDYDLRLPYGRPINPISGTNWEGSGVQPHIPVPAAEALKTAHLHALASLIESAPDDVRRATLSWLAEMAESEYNPVTLTEADLASCTGEYGPRRFTMSEGTLVYGHRDYKFSFNLVPMSATRFRLDEDLVFDFTLGQAGRATRVTVTYRDGRPMVTTERNG